jgi:P4 family phage/plasmid primase-like protien
MAKKPRKKFDLSYVRDCAKGRWSEILSAVGGISADFLTSETLKSPCPKCGGKDRYRFTNLDGNGSILCNQCGRDIGDGFGAIQWFTGKKFGEVLAEVAEYLGIEPEAGSKSTTKGADPEAAKDPTEHLEFQEWSDLAASYFCLFKPGVTIESLRAVGAKLALYRKQFSVIAIPVWGSNLDAAAPVGWTIYHAAGGTLPKFTRGENGELLTDQVKVKLTAGSKAGISGDLERLRKSTTVWKVEGYSDLLAMLSLPGLPADYAVITNANGCWEKPKPWFVQLLADKKCFVIHDNDVPGQTTAVDEWCPKLGAANVVLPAGDYGKDLRDWVKSGGTWEQLSAMAAAVDPTTKQLITRHDDDPRRLAEVNQQRYMSECEGVLKYWNDTWYTWKRGRGCYVEIKDYELETKIGSTIQSEFDRIAMTSKSDDEEQKPKKVTVSLVNNVIRSAKSLALIPNSVEINSLISTRKKAQYISLKNGILDVAGLLSGSSACFIPHTPDYFSLVCLPYDFNIEATAPTWERTLSENMEWDQERIDILQEWAGYLLLPTTDHQKFLFLEGEGANGKSVYLAGIEAMLGVKNCSHVPLEVFGQQFMLTQTLGKLANIAAECSEMDAIAEGYLKSFTSGDRMSFNRKGIDPIEAEPTARLMLSANMRPRFADRTEGLWRRMLLIPWRTKIDEKRRKRGMDKVTWWEQSGELPGILNWAIEGLIRLNTNGKFTFSKVSDEAMKSYRDEVNPTRQFISEHYVVSTTKKMEKCSIIYDHYKEWAFENGYRPVSSNTFGRELSRQLRGVVRDRKKEGSDRHYFYLNIERKPDDEDSEDDNQNDNKLQLAGGTTTV